jgi:upstream activation factor subunit UAF30
MAKRPTRKSVRSTRKTASKSTRKAAARPARKTARKPNPAFMRPVTPSEELAEVVGTKPIPRTEVTKRLWAYIKKNKLQDAKNKRMIKADETLKPVFGGKATVNMFEMTKLVNKHVS